MIKKRRLSKLGIFIFSALWGVMAWAAQPCTKDWALDGQMKTKSYLYGLGLSTKADPASAAEEAKSQAMKDVSAQLLSSVQSSATLNETDSGSDYSSQVKVQSQISNLTGMKIVKEGSDPGQKITSCMVAKFDAGAAYTESEGKMNVLMQKLKEVSAAAKSKKYVEVLQKRAASKKTIESSMADISRADMFLIYLKAEDETWYSKIKLQETEIDQVAEQAKSNIVFLIPEAPFEGAMADIDSRLSGEGFEVVRDGKTTKTVKIALDIKQIGAPRKTKTPLGITYVAKIMINLKESGRTIASNKGADVIGTGSNDDDALANIDRQLTAQVLKTLQAGLPGLISETE